MVKVSSTRFVAALSVLLASGAACGFLIQLQNGNKVPQFTGKSTLAQANKQSTTQQNSTSMPAVSSSTPNMDVKISSMKRYPAITREEAIKLAKQGAVGHYDPMDESKGGAAVFTPGTRIDQTKRPEAVASARQHAGRNDPMQAISNEPLITSHLSPAAEKKGIAVLSSASAPIRVPPPPINYSDDNVQLQGVMNSQPRVAKKPQYYQALSGLRLSAIVGDKALLLVPKYLQRQNGWPRSFCLAKGDSIQDAREHNIQIASVSSDSVVLEEGGEKLAKSLSPVR